MFTECADAYNCNTSSHHKDHDFRSSQTSPGVKEVTQVVCSGDEFPCAGICLGVDKLCNGFLDCRDYSDEGERMEFK